MSFRYRTIAGDRGASSFESDMFAEGLALLAVPLQAGQRHLTEYATKKIYAIPKSTVDRRAAPFHDEKLRPVYEVTKYPLVITQK